MQRLLYFLVLAFFVGLPLMAQVPSNDTLDTAADITTLPFTSQVDTLTATTEENENCWGATMYNGVWYKFTPLTTINVEFNTFGSNFDTNMGVFQAYDWGLYSITCNDDTSTEQSQVMLTLNGGSTYYIAVGSTDYLNPGGDLHFYAAPIEPPVNDDISNAISIGPLPFTYKENTFAATVSGDEPRPSCSYGVSSVWFVYDAAFTGSFDIGTGYDGNQTAVYVGSPGALTEVACGTGRHLIMPVTAGTRYYVQIEATYGWYQLYDLSVSFAVGPPPYVATLSKLTGIVSPSNGRVTINTVLTCNRTSWIYISLTVKQQQGNTMVQTSYLFNYSNYCEPGMTIHLSDSAAPLDLHAGRSAALFRAGKAIVSFSTNAYDQEYGGWIQSEPSVTMVRLKAGPAK